MDNWPTGWVKEPKINFRPAALEKLPEDKRREVLAVIEQRNETLRINPLYGFYCHSEPQHGFMASKAFLAAVFAGNQFGKSLSACILALINCIPLQDVPPHLIQYRTYFDDQPFQARIVVPTLDKQGMGTTVPHLRRWVPQYTLKNGKWDSAWSNKFMNLEFRNGSGIEFRSNDQDVQAHAGPARNAIYFDEAPSREIYEENRARTLACEGGHLRFMLTPIKWEPWLYHDIYKKRNEPGIDVFSGSIHDNSTLPADQVEEVLSGYTGAVREAREFGRFVSMEGRIYDSFTEGIHVKPRVGPGALDRSAARFYLGIDPGIRQPAAVLMQANHLLEQVLVFDEVYPTFTSTMNVKIFCELIHNKLMHWGITKYTPIIDPAARIRDQNTGQQLLAEFHRHKIYAIPGDNSIETGITRVTQLLEGTPNAEGKIVAPKLVITKNCPNLQDEFELYSWSQKREDEEQHLTGKPKPKKGHDHGLDALRYAVMALPWGGLDKTPATAPPKGSIAEALQNEHRDEDAGSLESWF